MLMVLTKVKRGGGNKTGGSNALFYDDTIPSQLNLLKRPGVNNISLSFIEGIKLSVNNNLNNTLFEVYVNWLATSGGKRAGKEYPIYHYRHIFVCFWYNMMEGEEICCSHK